MQIQDNNHRYAGWRESGKLLPLSKGLSQHLVELTASVFKSEAYYQSAVIANMYNDDGASSVDAAQAVVQRARSVLDFFRKRRSQ